MADDRSVLEVVDLVQRGAKYAHISGELVARLAGDELLRRRNVKEAAKSVRRKLHQAGAVYMGGIPPYGRWLADLKHADAHGDRSGLEAICVQALAYHQSSRERLPILERIYRETLSDLGPIAAVMDLACGLNPLTIPWMPLEPGARYVACDIYTDLTAFMQEALPLLGVVGDARTTDLSALVPEDVADVALLLKAIPCLEQLDSSAGARLLQGVRARYIVASFPVQSLGGRRDRGMPSNYRARMAELTAGQNWAVVEYSYESELVFVADKGA